MESVHKSSTKTWIKTPINVRKFRDDWCAALELCASSLEDFSEKEYAELEEACGMDAMKCPSQTAIDISKELIIPEDTNLVTLRLQKKDLEKRKACPTYDKMVQIHYKEFNYPSQKNSCSDKDATLFAEVEKPEVILTVQVYRPELRSDAFCINAQMSKFQVDQEFMVLGSQYLVELRDKIGCVADKVVPGDLSEMPNDIPKVTCGDIYKSGYFYIAGVFYNDMRHPDCRDYSTTVIEWAESKSPELGPFKKALMEETRFIDLDIQLGYPYLYTHQGNCEHVIVFDDLVMHTHHYSNNKYDYPIQVNLKEKKRMFCMTCNVYTVEWIVRGNKRLPIDPFFFCKKCFLGFNYAEDGKKIGNFQAYHHYDRSNIL